MNPIIANPNAASSRVPDRLTQQDFNLEPNPTENNLTEGQKRITLKMIGPVSVPKNCFVTLGVKGKSNHGKKFHTKTISTRNSDWNQPFSFYVAYTENGVISAKIKEFRLIGMRSSTIGSSHTFLSELTNGTTHNLLPGLKVEVEIANELQENQPVPAEMKRDRHKSKAKLILREITYGIDPLHAITFGPHLKFVLGQNKKESIEKPPQKKTQDFLTRHEFLHRKNRYTSRQYE